MDDDIINDLRAAYAQTPESVPIFTSLLRSLQRMGRLDDSIALLDGHDGLGDFLNAPADRHLAAEVFLSAHRYTDALSFANQDTPAALMLRARAHIGLGDAGQAQILYRRAVQMDAALEDVVFEKEIESLSSSAPAFDDDKIVRLGVVQGGRAQQIDPDTDDRPLFDVTDQLDPFTFANVGGLDDVKKQIRRRIITPFLNPSLYQKFRRKAGGGVLLYGPPGCGKTLIARATAGECNARFYNIEIAEVLDMYIGESEKRLAAVFEEARRNTPVVLFFDELDALAAKRSSGRDGGVRLISQFLAEMDGLKNQNEGLLILGATNVPWMVDPAFRRPGRFDRLFFVPPPDQKAREVILNLQLEDRPAAETLQVDQLAKSTSGFSGADLKELIETACDCAIEDSLEHGEERHLSNAYLRQALKELRATTGDWLTTARNYAQYANQDGQYDEVLAFIKAHTR